MFSGFAEGGLISNLIVASDGEFIVNAADAAKNRALLEAINAGKLPRLGATSNFVNQQLGARQFALDQYRRAGGRSWPRQSNRHGVSKALHDARPDSFRRPTGQIMSEAATHLQRANLRHG